LVDCVICKFGHKCPHTGKVDDLLHALMFIWEDVPDQTIRFDDYCKRFEQKDKEAFKELTQIIKKRYEISIEFEFGYENNAYPPIGIEKCEKFTNV
jgi:hypothetical protein